MYTNYYRFHAEPFLLTPDHHFYFDSSVHSQAMAYLTYGVTRGEGFIVITGEVGAGKTTLVQHLCASLSADRILCAHVVTTQLEGFDLLRMVASAFGVKDLPADKSLLLIRLQRFFSAALESKCRVLLIVDEAQNLPISSLEELRMLSNFQVGNVAPFQSFLIGQPQFRTMISSPDLEQLRQRIIASFHLGPMNAEECGKYVIHRLQTVGWRSDPSFDSSALEAIYFRTGGIPRRINTLCNRLFLLGMLDNLHHFSDKHVERVAADLASELSNGRAVAASASELVLAEPGSELPQRVSQLERRVARQEALMKQAASTLRNFLTFSDD